MRALMLFGLAASLACTSPSPELVKDEPEATPTAAPPPGTRAAMVAHFQESLRIEHAVIDGDLAALPEAARRLEAQLDAELFPAEWRPYLERAGQLARAAGGAHELADAAAAAAQLAATCGECHATSGAGPSFPRPGTAPAAGPHDTRAQMARHEWAAGRMWEGLVGRSDVAWTAGAAVLLDAPLSLEDITDDVELPDEVLRLGGRVHDLAGRASQATDWPTRTAIYGQFLASCAGCHQGGC